MQPDLDEVLHCVALIVYCREADRAGRSNFDLGAILGQVDWAAELQRIMEEWKMSTGTDEFGTPHDQTEFPNNHQVGGSHYAGGAYQHWDWVAQNRLGYFEGQITKYIVRWKKKNGVVDLEKSLHYLDKLIELVHLEKLPLPPPRSPVGIVELMERYHLEGEELFVCMLLCVYTSLASLNQARAALVKYIAEVK